jgi:hypothetical protein
MSDPDFIERKSRRRRQILRFREKQQRLKHWIGFAQIADWIACDHGANERRDEALRDQGYLDLLGSVMEGVFDDRWGRTRVIYLDPDGVNLSLWLTKEHLQSWLSEPVVAGIRVVINEVLPRCWVSRAYARVWFERTERPWPVCFDSIADASQSRYDEYFIWKAERRRVERRAQDAADAKKRWISYPEAVHLVLPVLFKPAWVGIASEQEHVILHFGPFHRDWHQYSILFDEREEQIARAERWLLVKGLLEDRGGRRLIQVDRLEAALADEAANAPAPANQATLPPRGTGPASATLPSKRRRGRAPSTFNRVRLAMIADLRSGERDPREMREKEWQTAYNASRDTCRRALATALQEFNATNSDNCSSNDK